LADQNGVDHLVTSVKEADWIPARSVLPKLVEAHVEFNERLAKGR